MLRIDPAVIADGSADTDSNSAGTERVGSAATAAPVPTSSDNVQTAFD